MWEYQWPDKPEQLGRDLFKRGARYLYIILTQFNDNIKIQDVDDHVLKIAFALTGCVLPRIESKSKLTLAETNSRLFNIFNHRKPIFLERFPDLKDLLTLSVNIQIVPIEQESLNLYAELNCFVNEEGNIINNTDYNISQTEKVEIVEFLSTYFRIKRKPSAAILNAFDSWLPEQRKSLWDGEISKFQEQFLKTYSLKKLHIFNINGYTHYYKGQSFVDGFCHVYFSEYLKLNVRDTIENYLADNKLSAAEFIRIFGSFFEFSSFISIRQREGLRHFISKIQSSSFNFEDQQYILQTVSKIFKEPLGVHVERLYQMKLVKLNETNKWYIGQAKDVCRIHPFLNDWFKESAYRRSVINYDNFLIKKEGDKCLK